MGIIILPLTGADKGETTGLTSVRPNFILPPHLRITHPRIPTSLPPAIQSVLREHEEGPWEEPLGWGGGGDVRQEWKVK